ncbi:hypothetical protein ACFWSF_19465 [Streptomyces sp. NPDC058611]
MLFGFTHVHDGERLGGGYGGDPSGPPPWCCTAQAPARGLTAPLAREFVAHGCRAVAFDFSGHGESTDMLAELSLRQRFERARSGDRRVRGAVLAVPGTDAVIPPAVDEGVSGWSSPSEVRAERLEAYVDGPLRRYG